MLEDSDILFPIFDDEQNNPNNNNSISKMQLNLIMMGFEIDMINKIISIFKIKTEEEAIDYLIKSDNGMWNHPFIPKEEPKEDKKLLLDQSKNVMNNVITTINTIKNTTSFNNNQEDLKINDDENNISENDIIKIPEDICEICGESKDFHSIKEYKYDDGNANIGENINNNKLFDDINNDDENINLLNENKNKNDNNNNIALGENGENIEKKEEEEIKEKVEEEEVEENDPNPNECKICMDIIENPVEIENCKHIFCRECFHDYLVNLIIHNQIDAISCPKSKCKNKKLSENFFSQFLSEQEYFKYRQFKAQNEIARDKKKIFCPLCDSYADIGEAQLNSFDSNDPNYIKSSLKCKNGHEFCTCGRPLHEGTCYQDEKEFKDFVVSEKIKKCPKCGFLIKKNSGCNHMICGNPICKYEFCWLCMQEAVPNHFDYGPCAGKQFFDPDSFANVLKRNHPVLYVIYCLFMGILIAIVFVICCMAIPGLSLVVVFYAIIFEEAYFNNCKSYAKIIIFMGYILCGFALETLVYIAWAVFFGAVAFFIVGLILAFIITIIRYIFKFICCAGLNDFNLNVRANNNHNNNNNNNNNIIDDFL